MTWHEVPPELLDTQPAASKRGRKKRADLPSPGIRKETLGFFPVSGLSVSALQAGTADAMLGFANDALSTHLKDRRKIRVQSGKQTEELDLKGKFYNGLADAFYRAQLPQVLIVSPQPDGLIPFVDEVLDYLEKLVSLGFFLRKKDPVQEYVPCFVITSEGIVFNNVMSMLAQHLYNIVQLDEYQRRAIMEHFVRGVFRHEAVLSTEVSVTGSTVELATVPTQIRLAGANQAILEQTRAILSRHGLVASVENRVPNGMERLEFEESYRQISAHLPQLQAAKLIKPEEAERYQARIGKSILEMGRIRRAFDEIEDLDTIPASKAGNLSILPGSIATYRMLGKYAESLSRPDDARLFETLQSKVAEYLRK